jgi:hypothetical protein
MLLAGWIMGQLGLRVKSAVCSEAKVTIETEGERSISFEIFTRPFGNESSPAGAIAPPEPWIPERILSVTLSSEGSADQCYFSVHREPDEEAAFTCEKTPERGTVQRRVRQRHRTLARLVADELAFTGRDVVFETALGRAADAYAKLA